MTVFRGCRYQVLYVPKGEWKASRLWSRHHSYVEALKSYRSLVTNRRGDVAAGTWVELRDVGLGSENKVLEQGAAA